MASVTSAAHEEAVMYLRISIDGANADEVARAMAAATAVFDRAGVTPLRAAEARYAVEGWDIAGFVGEITPEDLEIYGVWDEAEEAALRACCAGWDPAAVPVFAIMEIVEEVEAP